MASRRAPAYLALSLLLGACSPADPAPADTTPPPTTRPTPAATATTTTEARPLTAIDPAGSYAVVAFAAHLPRFGTTAEGAADRPWARLHATRDYLTLTRLVAAADAKVVISMSPILLEQIAAIAAGQWDHAAILTAKPAGDLTAEDKAYMQDVFFRSSPAQIDRFPRYRELADRQTAGRSLSTTDYRDLQVLFNLAWTSPLLLEEEPLLAVAARGRRFSADDKQVLLDVHQAALQELLNSLGELWDAGRIEVATTPLANPTLPLLVRNRMDQDAADQIVSGAARAEAVLGRAPRGLVPNGGLIDQANDAAIHEAGLEWLLVNGTEPGAPIKLSSEAGNLLALPIDPTPGANVAQRYFVMDPNAAAFDLVGHVSSRIGGQPGAATTLLIDASEPWARFEDGGIAFLRSLLRQLATADDFSTALPHEINSSLAFDPGPYPQLPSSYLFEADELASWTLLIDTRKELLRARETGVASAEAVAAAYENVLVGQGADWVYWYGDARSSGEDDYYDALYRNILAAAWMALGADPPRRAGIPLFTADPAAAVRRPSTSGDRIQIDNSIRDAEWSGAGRYEDRSSQLIRRFHYTFTERELLIRIDFTREILGERTPGFDLYLGAGDAGDALTPLDTYLGFTASRVLEWRALNPVAVTAPRMYPEAEDRDPGQLAAGFDGDSIEFAVELLDISPDIAPGDTIDFRLVDVSGGPEVGLFPGPGRGTFGVPNLEAGVDLANIPDRLRDDYGPGTYSYVADSEVREGTYDLAGLNVRQAGLLSAADPDATVDIQFEISFRQPLVNTWNAPAGFSHQTIDIYVNTYPGTGSGTERLLPGRVAAADDGWDYAISIDGWDGAHFRANTDGTVTELDSEFDYAVLADRQTILVTVPRSELPEGDATIWRYGVAILATRAIPTLGLHSLSELAATPSRFQIGGSTGAVNDPRIIDLLHPDAGGQEDALTYPAAVRSGDPETVNIGRLARLPFLPT